MVILPLLAACERQPSPTAIPTDFAEVVGTKESTSTTTAVTTPTQPAPTLTATPTTTVDREVLPEPSSGTLPELPEMATSTPPAPDELETVDAFVARLQEIYSISPLYPDAVRRALRSMLERDFSFELHPIGHPAYLDSFEQLLGHLSLSVSFRPLEPVFMTENIEDHLPSGVTPEAFYTGERPLEAVVYSTGWGQDGTAEALLYLTREQGALRCASLALSRDNFAPLPELETVAPPPGLVYQMDDEWWQVDVDGEAYLLLTHSAPLSFNPSATYALYAENAAQSLTLFDLTETGAPVTRTLAISFSLMQGSWHMPWLDEETALMTVTEPDEGLTQGTIGHMALLDVVSEELEMLAPEVSIYAQPAPTQDGAIIYDALDEDQRSSTAVWRNGEVTPLALAEMAGLEQEPYDAVPSADGALVAAKGPWPSDPNLTGYWVFDLEQQATHAVLGYTPPGTDANLPQGIFWHPSGEWLVLEPQTGDPLQAGVWVMRPDGGQKQFLGVGTANPLWLEGGARLLFNATIDGEQRLQLLDVESGERFWVEIPLEARPVQ